jgi:hypothetical protein
LLPAFDEGEQKLVKGSLRIHKEASSFSGIETSAPGGIGQLGDKGSTKSEKGPHRLAERCPKACASGSILCSLTCSLVEVGHSRSWGIGIKMSQETLDHSSASLTEELTFTGRQPNQERSWPTFGQLQLPTQRHRHPLAGGAKLG